MRRTARRSGFSLIEMMLVVAIIGILVALVAAAVMKMAASVPRRNTELLLQKLTAVLQKQWDAVIDQAKTEPISNQKLLLLSAGNSDPAAVRGQYVRARLQQEFPDEFAKVASSPVLAAKPAYVRLLVGVSPPPPTPNIGPKNGSNSYESSICLWMALSEARAGMDFDVSSLSPRELRVVPRNPGLKYICDHWGEPIRFYFDDPDQKSAATYTRYPSFKLASAGPDKLTFPTNVLEADSRNGFILGEMIGR